MKLVWDEHAWEDYLWWQAQDRKTLRRINLLIRDIVRNGNEGIGKPEPLKHDFAGYWSRRIDDEHVQWIGLDLPEVVELREAMLPADPRQRNIAASVLDESWMDEIDPREKLLFTAQGLLMYLRPSDVYGLIRRLAQRFPGSSLVFDGVPLWYSSRTIRGQIVTDSGFQVPEMLWGLGRDERVLLRSGIPGVADVRETRLDRGRGILFGEIVPAVSEIPGARHRLPYPSPIVLSFLRPARMTSAQSPRTPRGAAPTPRA